MIDIPDDRELKKQEISCTEFLAFIDNFLDNRPGIYPAKIRD